MPLHVSSTCVLHQEVKIALHSLWYHHTYRCVMQFWPPDEEHTCSKHAEAWNKLIVKKNLCIKLVNYWGKKKVSTIVTLTTTKREHCSIKRCFYFINDGICFRCKQPASFSSPLYLYLSISTYLVKSSLSVNIILWNLFSSRYYCVS